MRISGGERPRNLLCLGGREGADLLLIIIQKRGSVDAYRNSDEEIRSTGQGRAVCSDKPHARFGEGGTGDPLMGDRPLLYRSDRLRSLTKEEKPCHTEYRIA